MNILIINVALRPESPIKLFPIGLGFIATAVKRAGFEFDLIDIDANRYTDEEVAERIGHKDYDVVLMGCIVTGYKIIKKLASMIRRRHPLVDIIVGNSVATSITKTLLIRTSINIAVMGEGDETIVNLLHALKQGKDIKDIKGICFYRHYAIEQTPPRPLIKNISLLPNIDFSIFEVDKYINNSKHEVSDPLPIARDQIRALPVNTARGCIADCSFCYHVFKGFPYRYRTAQSIVNEIKELVRLYSINYVHFWDELTFYSKKQANELAQAIIESGLKVYWTAQCRANLFTNDWDMGIIELMKKAGCLGMQYSLESADLGILKAMNKHISVKHFSKQTKLFQNARVAVWTSLVLGYPQETPETIKKTFDCCIENKIYPSVGYLLPQPGSRMYDYAIKHGFITDEESYLMRMGDRQDLRLNMTQMPDNQFKDLVITHLARCNQELAIGLKTDNLIKTQYWRTNTNG